MLRVALIVVVVAASACGGPVGPQGVAGPPGAQGPKGDTGAPGAPGSGLVSNTHCTGSMSTSSMGFNLTYDVYRFADNSILTVCSVWASGFAIDGTNMWKSGTQGATAGGCLVEADIDSGSYGFWDFHLSATSTGVATYSDPGSAYDKSQYTLTCSTR